MIDRAFSVPGKEHEANSHTPLEDVYELIDGVNSLVPLVVLVHTAGVIEHDQDVWLLACTAGAARVNAGQTQERGQNDRNEETHESHSKRT